MTHKNHNEINTDGTEGGNVSTLCVFCIIRHNQFHDINEITQYYARMTQIHIDSMIWFGLLDYTYPRAYNEKLGGWYVMYNRASGGNPLYRYLTLN